MALVLSASFVSSLLPLSFRIVGSYGVATMSFAMAFGIGRCDFFFHNLFFFKSVILACGAYLKMIARMSVSFNRIVQMPTRQRYLNNNLLLKSDTRSRTFKSVLNLQMTYIIIAHIYDQWDR